MPLRRTVERRSAPVLLWLSSRPRFLLPAVVAVLLVGGAVLLNLRDPEVPEPVAGFGLDLQAPWALRGDPALVAPGALTGLRADWVAAAPLFAHRRGAEVELVLLQQERRRWAVASRRAGTWTLSERRLPAQGAGLLAAVLPDGAGRRLLAVADPDVDGLALVQGSGYAYGDDLTELADGVGEATLDDDEQGAVVGRDGDQVVVQVPLPG